MKRVLRCCCVPCVRVVDTVNVTIIIDDLFYVISIPFPIYLDERVLCIEMRMALIRSICVLRCCVQSDMKTLLYMYIVLNSRMVFHVVLQMGLQAFYI